MSKIINRMRRDERGMSTAEYAVGTVATCGFAGVLISLLTSDSVQGMLKTVIGKAFGVVG